jgi:hypothetical protein
VGGVALSLSGITSIYLHGIDKADIINVVHPRRAPLIAVSTTLRL